MANEKQISGKQRREAAQKILHSTLRLLVLLRETLRYQQVPKDNPLYRSVYHHANMVGALLPNDLLVSAAELENIQTSVAGVPTTTDAGTGIVEPAKPGLRRLVQKLVGKQAVVLNPDLSRYEGGE